MGTALRHGGLSAGGGSRRLPPRAGRPRAFEAVERADRLPLGLVEPVPGGLATDQRDEGGLAGGGVLGHPLAENGGVAFGVEQVVGDLEGEPEASP